MILRTQMKKIDVVAVNHLEYNMNIEQEIKRIISQQFNVDIHSLTAETNFNKDLGADSLDTVELVLAIEERFQIEILDDSAEKIVTIGDVTKYLKEIKN